MAGLTPEAWLVKGGNASERESILESIHFGFHSRVRCCGSDVPLSPTINILHPPDSSPISGFERAAAVGVSGMVMTGGKKWRGQADHPRGLRRCEEC